MSHTTTTAPSTIFSDYKAEDSNGHSGTGSTAESANQALQHSQQVDSSRSYHTEVFGWDDTPKDN